MMDCMLNQITIEAGFWQHYQNLVIETVIPYQERILADSVEGVEKSHAIKNFRIAADLEEGDFYGMVFQDSDVAKWLEGVAYALSIRPDENLEQRVDDIIDIIEKAQEEDGYLNTYFTIKAPDKKWQNLQECHELYNAGHMMEAAVAYWQVTGKDKLLRVMIALANHIDQQFGYDKKLGVPGHQEIELGLMGLYEATHQERYLSLAGYFLNQRGQDPDFFQKEKEERGWVHFDMKPEDRDYCQCAKPVREQDKAVGHSVRAVYMYTAMAKWATETGDKSMFEACEKLWSNITERQMYVTGGIGSTHDGEAFTVDYDLPNDTAYAETCASIGLVFFAKAMLKKDKDRRYGDIIEKVLYNGLLSGMSQDGKSFFYVNPLEVNPGISGIVSGHKHVLPERSGWYACACCPPNLVRMITSLADYIWSIEKRTAYCHLFMAHKLETDDLMVSMATTYPVEGDVTLSVERKSKVIDTLAIRIPHWAQKIELTLNGSKIDIESFMTKGYVYLPLEEDQNQITLSLSMVARRMYAHPQITQNHGKVAIMRGPVVYCIEGKDHPRDLRHYYVDKSMPIQEEATLDKFYQGMPILKLKGAYTDQDDLYTDDIVQRHNAIMTAIPYFLWGNRGLNQMSVWIKEL